MNGTAPPTGMPPSMDFYFFKGFTHAMNLSYQQAYWFYPTLFILVVVAIFLGTRHDLWRSFADNYKGCARFVLFVMMTMTVFLAAETSNWIIWQIKGKLSPEFPSLTISAIKMGLYGLELRPQLAAAVPPDQKDLFNCVYDLGRFDGDKYLRAYKDDPNGGQPIPRMSRDEILNEIKKLQLSSDAQNPLLKSCYGIKLQ